MLQASLVLEGGGMRGVYTAGILDFFLEHELFFQETYGVSAGACHAASYLAKQHGRAYHVITDYLDDKRYCSFRSLAKTGDLFGVEMVYDIIPNQLNLYDYEAYTQNPSKLTAVVTNCVTGEAEYHRITDMRTGLRSVRASASLPLLSRMVEINGSCYLDGGIADSIPLARAIADGFTKNVVVRTQPDSYRKHPNRMMPLMRVRYRQFPNLVRQMETRHTRYNRTLAYIKKQQALGHAFVLCPAQPLALGRIEKDREKLAAVYQQGYQDAERQYPALLAYLQA